MENNNVLAINIQKMRREKGMTQEAFAEKLGVTFQAVSKWENAKSAPDILLLPLIADLFGCSIDALFSHKSASDISREEFPQISWVNDGVIRGVVFDGRKVLSVTDNLIERFVFEVTGDVKSVRSECNVHVLGTVFEGCEAGCNLFVEGDVRGECTAGMNADIKGNVSGGCNSGMNVDIKGNVSGAVNCGVSVICAGVVDGGDINCGMELSAKGDIDAKAIICENIYCNNLKCDKIEKTVCIN